MKEQLDILTQAIRTRLPFIHVTTDDLVHIREVLSFIAEGMVAPLNQDCITEAGVQFPDGVEVAYTNMDIVTPKLYVQCRNEGKTIVFVNTQPSVLHFNCGVMFPPKALMQQYLTGLMEATEQSGSIERILPAYGGMTLKEIYEATMLTVKREEELSAKGVNTTRQSYVTKLRGMTQIDTKFDFYQCPNKLQNWMDLNLPFFHQDFSALTPRGLLFDGRPGTGKTMAAKHIAAHLGIPLYLVDIGGMKGKYVGDSETNLRAVLDQLDQAQPCVALFDEVEKEFGGGHEDTGVTSSMLGTILWWLQEHRSKVFTVMTTNNKATIPPELYREGRIDETMLFNGLGSIQEALEFAKQSFTTLTKGLAVDLKFPTFVITNKIQPLFSDIGYVPQVKIAGLVNATVKSLLLKQGEGAHE